MLRVNGIRKAQTNREKIIFEFAFYRFGFLHAEHTKSARTAHTYALTHTHRKYSQSKIQSGRFLRSPVFICRSVAFVSSSLCEILSLAAAAAARVYFNSTTMCCVCHVI